MYFGDVIFNNQKNILFKEKKLKMELTYNEGTYHDEIIKKLELLNILKAQSEHVQKVAKENINVVKADIDRSIIFHIENLQKRGSW